MVELGLLYTFLQVYQSFIYWKMHANSILDIHKKNHARIEIYIFLAQIMENEKMHTAKMKQNILIFCLDF